MDNRTRRPTLWGIGLALAYVAAAELGHQFAFVGGNVSPFWPAAGLAVVALRLGGARLWPGLLAGAVVAHLLTGTGPLGSVLIGGGNTLAAVCAATALGHPRSRWTPDLGSARSVSAFLLAGAALPAALAATTGIATLLALGFVDPADAATSWTTWWVGDAIGCTVVGAVAFTWTGPPTPLRAGRRETAGTVLGGVVILALVFGVLGLPEITAVPAMLYAALRLNTRWTAVLLAVMATAAGLATAAGDGPFASPDLAVSMTWLAVYFGSAGVSSLLLAGVVAERERMDAELTAANDELEARVRERTDQLWHQARHDELTGLANRAHLLEVMTAELRAGEHEGHPVALLFIDLDGFKAVNDRHGHEAGDEVLRSVGRRLVAVTRAADVVARVGGDELAVVLRRVDAPEVVAGVARGLLAAVRTPIAVTGRGEVRIGASVGAAIAWPGATAAQILQAADRAMYEVKRRGGHGFELAVAGDEVPSGTRTRQACSSTRAAVAATRPGIATASPNRA